MALTEPDRFLDNQFEPRRSKPVTAFTVRVPDATAAKLEKLAQKLDRPRSFVVAQAIEDFVEREAWQLAEIEAGLADAERGDFASKAELADVIQKYVKPARPA
jgi:predicted transcriptional regulator